MESKSIFGVVSVYHLQEAWQVSCLCFCTKRSHQITTWMRANPGSEFVAANTLVKWKKLEPNEINFSQGFSQKVLTSCFVFNPLPALSADNLCKQFGLRSGPTKCRAWSGSKLFETQMVLKQSNIQRVKYGTIIKCEGIIKQYSKIQRLIKIHFFTNM